MNSFKPLEDELRKAAIFSDLSVTEEPPERTKFQKLLFVVLSLSALLTNLTMIAFVYYHRNDLMMLLTQMEFSLVCITVLVITYVSFKNRDRFGEVMEWCKTRHIIDDPVESSIASPCFLKALEDSETAVKGLKVTRTIICIVASVGLELFKYFLTDNPYPLLFPIYFFGFPATNPWTFSVTLFIQLLTVFANVQNLMIFHMWVLISLRHTFASLESVLLAIREMQRIVEEGSFENWLKLVHSLLIDSTYHFKIIKELVSLVSYCEQKTMFMVLFVGYLTVKIDPSNLPISVTFIFFIVVIFLICCVNEAVKQKYKDISLALYELPWYEMKPSERRLLIPLMVAAQNHPVLRAGGLDEMTFENFLQYIKGAYSTAILMENLIYGAN